MCPKYKIGTETKTYRGHTLYQIVALRDFGNVKAGDRGGFIEHPYFVSEYSPVWNLSQEGLSWVYAGSVVYGSARVCENAQVRGSSVLSGHSIVSENACIVDSRVSGNAVIRGHAQILQSKVTQNAHIYDSAIISGSTVVKGQGHIFGNAQVEMNGVISGNTELSGIAKICRSSDYLTWQFGSLSPYTIFLGADKCLYITYRGATEPLADFEVRSLYYQPAGLCPHLLEFVAKAKQHIRIK